MYPRTSLSAGEPCSGSYFRTSPFFHAETDVGIYVPFLLSLL